MDDRLRIDLQALEAAEVASINQLTSAGTQAAEQIQSGAQQASGELDAVAAALTSEIDRAVEEAEVVVSAEEEPYLPGIADVIPGSARWSDRHRIWQAGHNLDSLLSKPLQCSVRWQRHLLRKRTKCHTTAQQSADSVQGQLTNAIDQTRQNRVEQAASVIHGVDAQQQNLIASVLTEVDRAIAEVRRD